MTTSKWNGQDLSTVAGKTFIVTGATSGIGEATARMLAAAGAHVVLAVRNIAKGEAVAATIPGETEVRLLDLGSQESIRQFADAWSGDIDVLINNAGIMNVPQGRTVDGFELQVGTNHLGPFTLTNLLLPHVRGRVVTLSSELHRGAKLDVEDLNWERRTYKPSQAYKDSKLAGLLFARELHSRLQSVGSPVVSVAAHPGVVKTALLDHVGGVSGLGIGVAVKLFGHDVNHGALPSLYASTGLLRGGEYVGPNGFQQLRGYPAVVKSSKTGENMALARSLWEKSAELTGAVSDLAAGK